MDTATSVQFNSRDGLPLNGTWQPSSGDVSACVLFVHGIHSEQHESGFYTDIARLLADRNVASLRFDWRTQGANELPFRDLTLTGIVNDIHAAWRFLSRQSGCADKPLILIAASFGGGPAIVWARDHAKAANARHAILLAPVLDYTFDLFRHDGIDSDGYLTPNTASELAKNGEIARGDLLLSRQLINELPNFDAGPALAGLDVPTTLIHGERDSDVPPEVSKRFADLNPRVDFKSWPGVDHGFTRPGTDFTDPINDEVHAAVANHVASVAADALESVR